MVAPHFAIPCTTWYEMQDCWPHFLDLIITFRYIKESGVCGFGTVDRMTSVHTI